MSFERLIYVPSRDGELPTVKGFALPGRAGVGIKKRKPVFRPRIPKSGELEEAGQKRCSRCERKTRHRRILTGGETGVVFCTRCGWQRARDGYRTRAATQN